MLNYTCGDWHVEQPEVEPKRLIIDCELPKEGEKRFHRSIARTFGYCDSLEEEWANARLIAASPRMYEILDAIREEQIDGISRQIWIKRETLKLLTEMEGRIDGN